MPHRRATEQKWLKDRKGQHYRAIIAALVKTAALMK